MSYLSTCLADSPSFFWKLSDTGSTAADATGNGNTGTYNGGYTQSVAGPSGVGFNGTSFDGSTGYVAETASGSALSVFTMEFWFKTSSNSEMAAGFSDTAVPGTAESYDRSVTIESSGYPMFYVAYSSPFAVSTAANDGNWHYVAAVCGASELELYLDNGSPATLSGSSEASYTGYWLAGAAGGIVEASSAFFDGALCAFAIYPSALSADQVAAHYAAASGGGSSVSGGVDPDYDRRGLLRKPFLW